MATEVHDALARLEDAVGDGRIAAICREFEADLLVVFGSTIAGAESPGDLDIAVRFARYDPSTVLIFLDRLAAIADTDALDFVVLNTAGPVIKERALLRPLVLYESRPGVWANAQIAAIMERMETAPFRKLDLELMAR